MINKDSAYPDLNKILWHSAAPDTDSSAHRVFIARFQPGMFCCLLSFSKIYFAFSLKALSTSVTALGKGPAPLSQLEAIKPNKHSLQAG